MYGLTVLEARRTKSGCLWCWFFPKALKDHLSTALLLASVAGNPWCSWLAEASLPSLPPPAHSHLFLLCLCVLIWPSYKDGSHSRAPLIQDGLLYITCAAILFLNKATFMGSRIKMSTYLFKETQFNPHYACSLHTPASQSAALENKWPVI